MNKPDDRDSRNRTTLHLPHPAPDLTQRSNCRYRTRNSSSMTSALIPPRYMFWNHAPTTARIQGSGAAVMGHKTMDSNRQASGWSAIDYMNSEPK
jgi:hypothetical protein